MDDSFIGKQPSNASRLQSLDVLRGLTIAAMILVNNPGDWGAVWPPLLHAYWTRWTFADLVFPAFIFIMGAAMPFAFARWRAAGASTSDIYRRVVRRVALLIVLGLALNAIRGPADLPLRWPGVLQRIAVVYLLASLVVLHIRLSRCIALAVALLLGHWVLLALVPFGGYPAGTLTPEHNLARAVDTRVFGSHVLAIPNDPEGLLGTLSAAATALIGASTGVLMRRAPSHTSRVHALALGGALALGFGIVWSDVLPASKPLWTGSFVLITAGVTALALAATGFLVDVRRVRGWSRPFLWLGVNPLAIYVCSEVVARLLDAAWLPRDPGSTTLKAWLFWEWLEPAFRPRAALASWTFAAAVVALWTMVAGLLYRARIRVAV